MRAIAPLVAALLTAISASAAAQDYAGGWTGSVSPGWGMSTGSLDDNWLQGLDPSSDWRRCANIDHDFDLDNAISACTRILEEHGGRSTSGVALWFRAQLYEDQDKVSQARQDWDAAIALFTEEIAANPREPYGYNNRAATLVRIAEYDRALADYGRAIELDRHLPNPHAGRGQIYFRRGDYAAAVEEFDEAYHRASLAQSIAPGHHAYRCTARAAARVDLEEARTLCDRAIRNSRNAAYALAARGYLRFMNGDIEGANADFARGVDRDAWDAQSLYGRGVTAIRLGRQTEGEADVARALQMNRYDVEYYANAGLIP